MSPSTQRRAYAPRMPAAERREKILDAALELINAGGVEAVTMDAIAKSIQVTRPVVYNHFTDANHILREVMLREGNSAMRQLEAVMPKDLRDTNPAAALGEITRGFIEAVHAAPSRWRAILLPSYGGSPPAWQKFKKRSEETVHKVLSTFLTELLGDKGRRVDIDLAAHLLLRSLEEIGRLALADPEAYSAKRLTIFANSLFETLQTPRRP